MSKTRKNNDLFQTSHLTLLVSYTIFAIILVVESLLLGWEKWALLLIIIGICSAWVLHIRHTTPDNVRLWLYAILMMGCFFFYGVHQRAKFFVDFCPVAEKAQADTFFFVLLKPVQRLPQIGAE